MVWERPSHAAFLDLAGAAGLDSGVSEYTARRIDAAVRALVDEAFARATVLLQARRALLDEGVAKLLADETLTEAALQPLAHAARQAGPPPP